MVDIETTLAAMRSLRIDHAPDGWPAVRMRDITALVDEIERLRGERDRWMDIKTMAERLEQTALKLADENERLSGLLAQALDALRMPCDRWNRRQSEIVNEAIKACEAALFSAPAENNGSASMELFSKPQSTSTGAGS